MFLNQLKTYTWGFIDNIFQMEQMFSFSDDHIKNN